MLTARVTSVVWLPLAILAASLATPASSVPRIAPVVASTASDTAVPAAYRERKSARRIPPRVWRAVPIPAPECPGLYSWNPANPDRGFCDPGFAYHGNINGCVIDQGYGRWASCDSMR